MIKVLIVEDEKLAADYLEILLKQIDSELSVEAKLSTIQETVSWLSLNMPDLIFMDIHLADGNCFSIFKQVDITAPIIFTTAFDQYALKAFKVNSIDYLLKPIDEKDLRISLQKFQNQKKSIDSGLVNITEILQNLNKKPEYKQRFVVSAGTKIHSIPTEDIAYFYILEKHVFLCTFNKKQFGLDYSLDRIESSIDPDKFFRVNRKYIVHLDAIDTIYRLSNSRMKLVLKISAPEDIVVSFHRLSDFRNWLNK